MERLSLAVLIDSLVFISRVEDSISSISRGFQAAAMGMTHLCVSLPHAFLLSLPFVILLLLTQWLFFLASISKIDKHVKTPTHFHVLDIPTDSLRSSWLNPPLREAGMGVILIP